MPFFHKIAELRLLAAADFLYRKCRFEIDFKLCHNRFGLFGGNHSYHSF